MTLAISINKPAFRFDSTIYPELTISGITDIGKLKLNDWLYLDAENGTQELNPPNYSLEVCPVYLRNVKRSTWTRDTGIDLTDDDDLVKSGSDGYDGAYSSTALSTVKCSLEAVINSLYAVSPDVLGLQDALALSFQTGTPEMDFTDSSIPHVMSFGDYQRGTIRELGVIKKSFQYEETDKPLMELNNGVVRYYLTKESGELVLLRTTRSKLSAAPKPVVHIYFEGGQFDNIFTFSNEEIAITFENAGALEYFQSWGDDYVINPTQDVIQMADNRNEYTYNSPKEYLRSLSLSRAAADKLLYRDGYIKFFQYHLNDKPFIFIDRARDQEFWARFTSGLGDKTRNGCQFQNNVSIIEDFLDKYIPLELVYVAPPDLVAPDPPGDPTTASKTDSSITIQFSASPSGDVVGYQYRLDGGTWHNLSVTGTSTKTGTISGLSADTEYDIEVRCYDGEPNYSIASDVLTETTNAGPQLLLDAVPGALFAYSATRKLRNAYAGSAFRIARSSGSPAQTDIGFDVDGNVDVAAIASFCSGTTGKIVTWYDQSGNGNDATANGNIYIYESGALKAVNGLPAFDLRSGESAFLELPSGLLYNSTGLSFIQVAKIPNGGGSNAGVFGPSSTFSTGFELLLLKAIGIDTGIRFNSATSRISGSNLLMGDNLLSLTNIYGNASAVSAFYNNSAVTLADSSAMPTLNFNGVYAIGRYASAQYAPGFYQEVIGYASSKDASQSAFATDINTYYSIY